MFDEIKFQLFFQHGLNWLNIFWKHPLEKKHTFKQKLHTFWEKVYFHGVTERI